MNKVDSLTFEFEADVNMLDAQTISEDKSASGTQFHMPHPIPYQGSKRSLAPEILAIVSNRKFRRLYEPFAGSAAITIAAANMKLANEYVIGDALQPLMDIWNQILSSPHTLASDYERMWCEQLDKDENYYYKVRDDRTYGPALPEDLHLKRLELVAGRSSQSTLSGRSEITVESLYVSEALAR